MSSFSRRQGDGGDKAQKLGIRCHTIEVADLGIPTKEQFRNFLRIMNSFQSAQGTQKVLVHCVHGIGRAGMFAAAYLIARKHMHYEDACRLILGGLKHAYRDKILRSPKFVVQLKQLGMTLNSFVESSMPMFPESPSQERFLKMVERNFRVRSPLEKRPAIKTRKGEKNKVKCRKRRKF